MRDAMSVLIRPVVSEKTTALMDNRTYVFIVDPRATGMARFWASQTWVMPTFSPTIALVATCASLLS